MDVVLGEEQEGVMNASAAGLRRAGVREVSLSLAVDGGLLMQ